jgi:hypothetical protein
MVVRQNDEWGFAGKKLASAKKILENIFWKWYHFGLKKTISFLYSEQSPTKIHT